MEYRRLGRTDLNVSLICLGTMTWGQQNTEADGHAQMDYALDQGVNFFDTAELYSIPPRPETQGSTERIIGSWFKARGNRDKVILASKVIGRSDSTWFRDDGSHGRTVPRPDRGGGRQEPEAAPDRLYRPLPDPLARPAHALGLEPDDLPPPGRPVPPHRRDARDHDATW